MRHLTKNRAVITPCNQRALTDYAFASTSTSATMLMISMSGLIAGPPVSLYGSPTVSPVTDALWASLPLPPWCFL